MLQSFKTHELKIIRVAWRNRQIYKSSQRPEHFFSTLLGKADKNHSQYKYNTIMIFAVKFSCTTVTI